MMSMWSGIDNGVATADMNPGQLAPTTDDQLQWPVWGLLPVAWKTRRGAGPARGKQLRSPWSIRWRKSPDDAQRTQVWADMLKLYTDPGLLDRLRQLDAPACAACRPPAKLPAGGAVRLRSHLIFRRLYAGHVPGWRGLARGSLHPMAHLHDGADAADHLGAGLHHHRASAPAIISRATRQSLPRRARTSIQRKCRRCARNMASTSRRCCAISIGSPACCKAISAIRSSIQTPVTDVATGCG